MRRPFVRTLSYPSHPTSKKYKTGPCLKFCWTADIASTIDDDHHNNKKAILQKDRREDRIQYKERMTGSDTRVGGDSAVTSSPEEGDASQPKEEVKKWRPPPPSATYHSQNPKPLMPFVGVTGGPTVPISDPEEVSKRMKNLKTVPKPKNFRVFEPPKKIVKPDIPPWANDPEPEEPDLTPKVVLNESSSFATKTKHKPRMVKKQKKGGCIIM